MQTVAGSKDVAERVFLLIRLKLQFGGQSFCVKLKSSDQKNEKYYTYFVCICNFFLTSQYFENEFIIKFLYKQALHLFKFNLLVI
jgi:hypothetical protein